MGKKAKTKSDEVCEVERIIGKQIAYGEVRILVYFVCVSVDSNGNLWIRFDVTLVSIEFLLIYFYVNCQ